MSGKVADPIFINGADDEVLVGDTVEIVAAEEAASNAGASLSTFENAIPENKIGEANIKGNSKSKTF